MSFTEGFEKSAGIGNMWQAAQRGVGKVVGTVGRGVAGTVQAVKGGLQAGAAQRAEGFRGAMQPQKALPGTNVGQAAIQGKSGAKIRAAQGGAALSQEQANTLQLNKQKELQSRVKSFKDARSKAKPSFAMKHPIITGAGSFLAAKQVFGDKQEQPQQPPAVIYPQQGY